ncbi:MAG: GNAT family N-acetyltransferase [Anaerolineales bacterium]|nr:GNAT family N-acetyltransferase [Anaerolineales bacterium]
MTEEFHIRAAAPQDAESIAYVQIKTWQHAYAHIFPQDQLAALDDEELPLRIERWRSIVRDTAEGSSAMLVAETNPGKLIGFANGGKQLKPEFPHDAELFTIYILPEFQGKGIGRRLISAAAVELGKLGYSSLLVWVLAENSPSRRFYEHLGGRFSGEGEYMRWGHAFPLAAYAWDSLETLIGE